MQRIILMMILAFSLAACAHKGVGGSFVGNLPQKDATSAIAEDAARYLAEEYAPGHTVLNVLTPEKDANNDFSAFLDAGLRVRGFTLSSGGSSDAVTVGYTLDSLKDAKGNDVAWYLHLRLSDGRSIARSYRADGSPEAGRSAAPLDKTFLRRASEKAKNTSDAISEIL